MFGLFGAVEKIMTVMKWGLIIAAVIFVLFLILRVYGKIKNGKKGIIKSALRLGKKKDSLNDLDSF